MPIDPATNSRFTLLDNNTYSELIATQVQLFYDPSTGMARTHFNGMPFLRVGEQLIPLSANDDILAVDFSNKMAKCYGPPEGIQFDPVTGADLAQVSVAGVMLLLKQAYDVEHNAHAAEIAAQVTAAQALAAAEIVIAGAGESPSAGGTTVGSTVDANGLGVTLADISTAGAGLTITGWTWIFGDGQGSSTMKNPTYTYAAPGTYRITLAVTDSSGVVTKGSYDVSVS